MNELLSAFLALTNETLTAAIVIVAASLLLYNLTRNRHDRVARTSSVVLFCVTEAYICDVFISLDPTTGVLLNVIRLQWLGIALIPVALFHLSDALLATTGLPSRGRRRRVIRILYVIGTVFFIAAGLTNVLITPYVDEGIVHLTPGPLFLLYVIYFIATTAVAFINVQRARQRCLTRDTRRRMGYLQFAMLMPALGLFPYSALLGPRDDFVLTTLILVNVSNIVVIFMLLFLAYPLSFFGSRVPDRVVKTELLRMVLRGPATAVLTLVTIIFTTPATHVLGLPGQVFMPFAVVTVVLLWQWLIALGLPWLEKRLIYPDEDDDQLNKLQNLSEQLLTEKDLIQLLEATLATTCDYLRVNTAYIVSLRDLEPDLVASIGPMLPAPGLLNDEQIELRRMLAPSSDQDLAIHPWNSYWLVPLYSNRSAESHSSLIGFTAIQARAPHVDLSEDERQMFERYIHRAAQALDDLGLQSEIYAALEGLLPQIHMTRSRAAEVEYRAGRETRTGEESFVPDRSQFVEQVRAALRHYWGGPGLTRSGLLDLLVIRHALAANEDNPVRALRAILIEAIESQRPEGERKMLSPEWTIYNILDLRFIEKLKVREVAEQMALSEPDLYRKQRVAIEAVADTLIDMERGARDNHDLNGV